MASMVRWSRLFFPTLLVGLLAVVMVVAGMASTARRESGPTIIPATTTMAARITAVHGGRVTVSIVPPLEVSTPWDALNARAPQAGCQASGLVDPAPRDRQTVRFERFACRDLAPLGIDAIAVDLDQRVGLRQTPAVGTTLTVVFLDRAVVHS